MDDRHRKKSQDRIAFLNKGRFETFEFAATEEGTFIPGLSIQIVNMNETIDFGDITLKAGYTYEAVVLNDNGEARVRVAEIGKRTVSANWQVPLELE